MPSHALHITRSNKRLLRRIAGVFYVAVTIAIITVCLRDWSQTWRIVSSPPARQLRSVNVHTEVQHLKTPTPASVEKTGATPQQNAISIISFLFLSLLLQRISTDVDQYDKRGPLTAPSTRAGKQCFCSASPETKMTLSYFNVKMRFTAI